jgi:ABC-2 type transport system permease protein
LVRKTLRDFRRPLIGWMVGLLAFFGVYSAFYPTFKADPVFYNAVAVAKYPGVLKDLVGITGSIAGPNFLQLIAYQLFGPMMFVMCAVILGGRAIAEPEEAGTLELVVTMPIDRRRLVLERFAGLALGLLALAVVTVTVLLIVNSAVGIGADVGNVLAAHTGLYLVTLFFGTLSLTTGAASGRRSLALTVAGAYAVGGYVIETLGKNVDALAWLRWLSPFHYYLAGRPLFAGWPVGDYLVILGATAVLVLTAALSFDRRDVGV